MNSVWIFLTCVVVHTLGTNVSSPYEVRTETINSYPKNEDQVILPQESNETTYRSENSTLDFQYPEIADEEILYNEDSSNSSDEVFQDTKNTDTATENNFTQYTLKSYLKAFPESEEITDELLYEEDSSNSSDEVRNSTHCPLFSIPCEDGTCVQFTQFCDGQGDCPDGSDEDLDFCKSGVAVLVCSNGQLIRGHDVRCDGVSDCEDGSDETGCSLDNDFSKIFLKPCNWLSHFQCSEGTCIDKSKVCDGVNDCPFGVDESLGQCALKNLVVDGDTSDSDSEQWKPEMFVCDDNQRLFTTTNARCNGINECDDGSDEINCEYTCANGVKIPTRQSSVRCDGVRSCPDGSDENDCEAEDIEIPMKIGSVKTETVFIVTTILLSVCLFIFFVIMIAQCRVNSHLRKMLRQAGRKQEDALTSVKTNPPPAYSEVVGRSYPSS